MRSLFIAVIALIFALHANAATVIDSYRYSAPNGGDGSLKDVISSAVIDLDATVSTSYSGSGTTWANLVTSPADGSAQTAYDFYTGNGATSTTYPTFNGSAGSSAAYWSFDGGDYFRKKDGAITSFLQNMHNYSVAGKGFWAAWTGNIPTPASVSSMFATSDSTSEGCLLQILTSTGNARIRRRHSGGGSSMDSTTSATGSNKIVVVSFNNETGAYRFWINSTTVTSSGTNTTLSTASSVGVPVIAAETDFGGALPNTSRLYSFAMGNEFLDDTKAAAIINALEARHGRNYAP